MGWWSRSISCCNIGNFGDTASGSIEYRIPAMEMGGATISTAQSNSPNAGTQVRQSWCRVGNTSVMV